MTWPRISITWVLSNFQTKKPRPMLQSGDYPFLSSTCSGASKPPRGLDHTFFCGRSSGYSDHPTYRAFPSSPAGQWHCCGFRPRSQRRVRSRFQRDSLLSVSRHHRPFSTVRWSCCQEERKEANPTNTN
jgi:hypothetical protein